MEIVNARVINAKIEKDYGFELRLTLDMGDRQMDVTYDMSYFTDVMDVIEIVDFDKIKNTPCRVKIDNKCYRGIGNFLKDEWFNIE